MNGVTHPMIKIFAAADGEDHQLSLLGTIEIVQGIKGRGITLCKQVYVKNFGKHIKTIQVPMYTKKALFSIFSTKQKVVFSRKITGVIGEGRKATPKGYVLRHSGPHSLSVPVYSVAAFPWFLYHVGGYIATDKGFIAVMKKQILFWIILGILACFGAMTIFLIYRFGFNMTMAELIMLLDVFLQVFV